MAHPSPLIYRARWGIRHPTPLLELAQLLAAFQGAQTAVEKVTTAHAAERKGGGHRAPAPPWVEGLAGHGMTGQGLGDRLKLRETETCTGLPSEGGPPCGLEREGELRATDHPWASF